MRQVQSLHLINALCAPKMLPMIVHSIFFDLNRSFSNLFDLIRALENRRSNIHEPNTDQNPMIISVGPSKMEAPLHLGCPWAPNLYKPHPFGLLLLYQAQKNGPTSYKPNNPCFGIGYRNPAGQARWSAIIASMNLPETKAQDRGTKTEL